MTPEEYASRDAVGLAEAVHRGEVSPLDLVELALARIAALEPGLGAVVALDAEAARRQARAVDPALPLAGVPFLVKDVHQDVAGMATRYGSRFFAEAAPAESDGEFVRRLKAAGVVVLGQTKTPEFAGDFVTEPQFGGPARNPWNLDRASGGSSGGAAAAVAARMVPAAHGTDCGGSIRVPAAACGLVGLKPTRGRNPQGPFVGERVSGLNAEGFLTRTVRDTAAFMDAVSGPEAGAPYHPPDYSGSWQAALAAEPGRLRIGVVLTPPKRDAQISPEVADAMRVAEAALVEAGHHIAAWDWPEIAGADEAAAVFWHGELAHLVETRARALGREPRADELEHTSFRALEASRRRSVFDYLEARAVQNRIARNMAAGFAEIDLLLLPATLTLPPRVGAFAALGYEEWAKASYGYAPFTEIFNLTGQPAIALPVAMSAEGLPAGVQLVARFGEEALLLAVAARLETKFGWDRRVAKL